MAAAIDELTLAEEQIIEHELAEDVSTVGNMDTVINATITSILVNAYSNNNANKEQTICCRNKNDVAFASTVSGQQCGMKIVRVT